MYQKKQTPRKALKDMTPAQQLQEQINRAQRLGVKVWGVGKINATGAPCWLVPSQSKALEGLKHIVSRAANGSLQCDCYACQNDHIVCLHRAVVFCYLRDQAAQAPKPAAPAAQPTTAQRAEAALPVGQEPFSIYKTERRPREEPTLATRQGYTAQEARHDPRPMQWNQQSGCYVVFEPVARPVERPAPVAAQARQQEEW